MLDAPAAEIARRAVVEALDANASLVRLDLTLTSDLDATGLAFLAAVTESAGGIRVELGGVRPELRPVLQATGVERLYHTNGA